MLRLVLAIGGKLAEIARRLRTTRRCCKSRGTPDRRRCDEKASGKMSSAFGAMTLKANEAERLLRGNLLRGTNHIFYGDRS
jgi:hypothetical protein